MRAVVRDFAGAGLLALTSPDRLHADWLAAQRRPRPHAGRSIERLRHIERLLAPLSRDARLVTVLDGHPAALCWLGGVRGQRVVPLGVEHFGQSGDHSRPLPRPTGSTPTPSSMRRKASRRGAGAAAGRWRCSNRRLATTRF